MSTPSYLITAASGNIGQHLIPLLLSRPSNAKLILPTSNSDRLKSQLHHADDPRVHIVKGDINDASFIEETVTTYKATSAVICLTGENELMVTLNMLDAIKKAGTVKHIVYVSAAGDYSLDNIKSGSLLNNSCGHVLVKYILEAKLKYGSPPRNEVGGFSWTVLGPTLFYSNDFRSKKSLLESSLFDEPFGISGVSRVDPADIALATANALEDDGHRWGGKKIMIGSKKVYTADENAYLWSEALGKPVKALGSDAAGMKAVENDFQANRSAVWGRDIRLMYEWFDKERFGMSDAEYEAQVELLGKSPSSYEEFVKTTAREWKEGK